MRKRSKQVSPLEDPNASRDPWYSLEQKKADRESVARGNSPYTPELSMGIDDYGVESQKSQTRKKSTYMNREEASRMVNDFDWSERYLRSIIAKYVSPDLADRLDYSGLRREARKVRGMAKKILGDRPVGVNEATNYVKGLLRG